MFCKLCGQQISEPREYCPTCGAKLEAAPVIPETPAAPAPESAQTYTPNPVSYQPNPAQYQPQGYQPNQMPYQPAPAAPKTRGTTGFSALGSNAAIFFITVGLFLMNIIFMYCPCISISYSRYYSYEYAFSMFGGDLGSFESDAAYMIIIGLFILLPYIGGIILSMLPVMANKKWSSKFFVCGRVGCIVGLCVFLLFFIILAGEASYYEDVTLTFWGWMYLLTNIGGFVLSIVAPSVICKGVAKKEMPPMAQPPVYNPPAF